MLEPNITAVPHLWCLIQLGIHRRDGYNLGVGVASHGDHLHKSYPEKTTKAR